MTTVTQINGTFLTAANVTCNATALKLGRDPDPDVAGIGVTLAFLIPAYLSLVFVIAAYCAGLISDELLTIADKEFFHVRDRVRDKSTGTWPRWRDGLRDGILSFSDTQLVFGIAILTTGFIKIQSISIYHIQCVTYLAWMSSNVHLTTLTVLRDYFVQNKVLRTIRITGMLILAVLLAVAMIPTGSSRANQILLGRLMTSGGDSYGFNAPARCFFRADYGLAGPVDPDAPWSFIILAVSYLWKISFLFDRSRNGFLRTLRAKPIGWIEGRIMRGIRTAPRTRHRSFFHRQRVNLRLTVWATLVLIWDFAESFSASLYFLAMSLAWGTAQTMIPRSAFNSSADYDSEENAWGFGQVLPLLLLLIPALTVLEHFWGHTEEDHESRPPSRIPIYARDDYYASLDSVLGSPPPAYDNDAKVSLAAAKRDPLARSSSTSTTTPHTPGAAGSDDDEASVALIASPTMQSQASSAATAPVAPPDPNQPILAFFSANSLSATERRALHHRLYRSRCFRAAMAWLHAGTIFLTIELIGTVLSGRAEGLLWAITLGIVIAVPVGVGLILWIGAQGASRLFREKHVAGAGRPEHLQAYA